MLLLGGVGFDGMAMGDAEACLYREENLRQGSRSILKGAHNEERYFASEIYGIMARKDHIIMRDLTEGEGG